MQRFYFTYRYGHKNYGGWIMAYAYNWRDAKFNYENIYGRDYLNFYEESLFHKEKHPRGELGKI